jgi:hypothetical protein
MSWGGLFEYTSGSYLAQSNFSDQNERQSSWKRIEATAEMASIPRLLNGSTPVEHNLRCNTDCCRAMWRREKTPPFTPLTFLLGASKPSLLSSSSSQRESAPTCVQGNRVYEGTKNHLLLNHPSQLVLDSRVVVHCPFLLLSADLSHRDFSQANAFDRGPDDRQATQRGA